MDYDIKKAIELGKIWMKNSIDRTHNFEHANSVVNHALKIFEELKPKGVTQDMVELAGWWHDAYKSRCKEVTWFSIYHEGEESSKILKQQVESLIPKEYFEKVSEAITNHNRGVYTIFFHKRMSELSLILIEADQTAGYLFAKKNIHAKRYSNNLVRFIDTLLTLLVPLYLRIIARSEYTKSIIKLSNESR